MAIVPSPPVAPIRAFDFVATLGINTHIDFAAYGYQNLATVEASINYLGVKNIRDSAESATDALTWSQIAQATGAKFDDYIAETSPSGMAADLSYVAPLAKEGILNFIEGGNEEDDFIRPAWAIPWRSPHNFSNRCSRPARRWACR